MADTSISEGKLIRYLKQCQSGSATDSEIVDGTGISLVDLRMILRQLKKRKVVKQEANTTPQRWTLEGQGTRNQQTGSQAGTAQDLESRVLQYLRSHPSPQKAIDISKGLRLPRKKEVNHVLYTLEKTNKVILNKSGKVPLWSLPGTAPRMQHQMFKPSHTDTSAPGAYSPGARFEFSGYGVGDPAGGFAYGWQDNSGNGTFRFGGNDYRSRARGRRPNRRGGRARGGQQSRGGRGRGGWSPEGSRSRPGGQPPGRGRGRARDAWQDYPTDTPLHGHGRGRGHSVPKTEPYPHPHPPRNGPYPAPLCQQQQYSGSNFAMGAGVSFNASPASDAGEMATGGNSSAQDFEPSTKVKTEDTAAENTSFDDEDDLNLEEDGGLDMHQRMQDIMGGNLGFNEMDYEYDDDMEMTEDYDLPEQVLLEMKSNPDGSHTCFEIALHLDLTEEAVQGAMKDYEDKGFVVPSDDSFSWCLTDKGKAHVRSLVDSDAPEPDNDHRQVDQFPTPLPTSRGPPPPPKELIKSDPVFGGDYAPAGVRQESGRQFAVGRGRASLGRGLISLASDMEKVTVQGAHDVRDVEATHRHTVTGTFDVRDIEASQTSATSPTAPATHTTQSRQLQMPDEGTFDDAPEDEAVSTTVSQKLDSEMPEMGWIPLSSITKQKSQGSSAPAASVSTESVGPAVHGFSSLPHRGEVTMTSFRPSSSTDFHSLQVTTPQQHLAASFQAYTVTSGAPVSGLTNRLQNAIPVPGPFAQEGLVMVPRGGTQATSSQSFHLPPTPMEIVGQQPRKTLTSPEFVSLDSAALPRSHSQPVLGSGPSSLPVGDSSNPTLQITSESFAALNKNPISALMEYAQSRRMQAQIEVVKQSGPSHRPVFVMAARVGTRMFPGVTCHNKKDGRKEAADMALRTLIAEGQYSAAAPTPSVTVPAENMTHFDKVAALTHQTFNSLIASIPENLAGRKVIAGLVMKRSEDDVGIVISIGTGNRCITGDKLSLEGNTVNDSHAEIITRRGFMRFLYQQLETYEDGKSHDLFERGSSGKLRIKQEITFHLYISTAPCGDGALFSPRDVESNSGVLPDVDHREHHPTFSNNVQGLLRTKMEGGEGTIPIDASEITVQTWDGVVRGERLRTMSCTDKICRWNVLGLQGALLSHFLEPIYLDSLTLGFLYDHGHLSRAVCCRLDRGEPPLASALPQMFHLNHPWLGRVTACQPLRETQKTKAFSINWTIGDAKPEVLDGTLGHCYTAVEKKLFSRVAKRCMYDSFKQVATHLRRSDLLKVSSYRNAKLAAQDFQTAKAVLMKKFQQTGCGAWVKKPIEEEMFS
ncbi:hypothetical protein BaRGS_00035511 [Batillaria attramentaria]|uniref:Uncharacterized protein n=1 Tax=Batillaria attramentaria TaxID=370345 RepID=A0ABD0JF81_9CAEN